MGKKLDQFGAPVKSHKHKESISSLNTTATAATINISYSQEAEEIEEKSNCDFELDFLKEEDICTIKEILDHKHQLRASISSR